jgi:hypothetical protein
MTDPSLNPQLPPKGPSLLDRIYSNNQKVIDWAIKLAVVAFMGWVALKLHYNGETGEFTKDLATKTNQSQTAVVQGTKELVKNEIGPDAKSVPALEAATQPAAQTETK